nr:MAG TPA: hypothetical protein [Caudoviricetes sp.]
MPTIIIFFRSPLNVRGLVFLLPFTRFSIAKFFLKVNKNLGLFSPKYS